MPLLEHDVGEYGRFTQGLTVARRPGRERQTAASLLSGRVLLIVCLLPLRTLITVRAICIALLTPHRVHKVQVALEDRDHGLQRPGLDDTCADPLATPDTGIRNALKSNRPLPKVAVVRGRVGVLDQGHEFLETAVISEGVSQAG